MFSDEPSSRPVPGRAHTAALLSTTALLASAAPLAATVPAAASSARHAGAALNSGAQSHTTALFRDIGGGGKFPKEGGD